MKKLLLLLCCSFALFASAEVFNGIDYFWYSCKEPDIFDANPIGEATIDAAYGTNLFTGHVSFPSSVSSMGKTYRVVRIAGCHIADSYYGNSVIAVSIPNSVNFIGHSVFTYCSPERVVISDFVAWCTRTYQDWTSNPLCGGADLYVNGYRVTDVSFPEGLKKVNAYTFYGCTSLTSMQIPKGVTEIASQAFSRCRNLRTVTIPEGVKSIGYQAFSVCESLTSVTIPSSVTSIGNYAFHGCSSLTSVTIPEGVTSIGASTFYNCSSLTSVTIPEGVTSIGNSAFQGCSSLTSVTIPEGVTSIGDNAFSGCKSLTSVDFKGEPPSVGSNVFYGISSSAMGSYLPQYASEWEAVIDANGKWNGLTMKQYITPDVTLVFNANGGTGGKTITQVAGTTLTAPTVTRTGYTFTGWSPAVPAIVPAQNVTYTAQWKINQYTLTFKLYDGAQDVVLKQDYATTLTAPTVTREGYTFTGWSPAVPATVPAQNVTYVAQWKKYLEVLDCSISNGKIRIVGCDSSISGEFKIPSTIEGMQVVAIEDEAFAYCTNLISIVIPEGVTSIGEDAFAYCESLTSVTIPSSVTSIGKRAFQGCRSITSLVIPANVKVLRESVFDGCSELTSLTLSEGITQLDFSAFAFCEGLTSVNLPSSLTKMSYSVFSFCSNLLNINVDSKNKTFKSIDGVVYNTDGTTLITVPAGRSEYEIPYGIKEIGPGAFCGNNFVTSVAIPNTVTKIGRAAFSGCAQLESIEFPDKLSQIETGMLFGSYSIKTIKIPSSVTYVKSYALQCEADEIWFGGKPPTVEKLDAFVDVTETLETSTIGYYPSTYADAWKRVIVNGKWNCLTMKMYTPVATVTLIFNANGGVGGTTVKQAAGTPLTAPTVTRTGYTFTGWSPAVPAKTPAQNVTYTAQWKKNTEQPDIGGGDNPRPEASLNVTYTRSGKKVIVTGKQSDFKGEALTIPAMIESCPVTEIAKGAFKGDTVLTAVTISEGVTAIGADAFKGCTALDPAQVTLPSTLKKVGKGAFTGCKVTEVSAVPGEPLTSKQLGKAVGYKAATTASGLKLNAKTGEITATFKKSGTYEAVLFKPGATLKAIRIKVGDMPKLTIKMEGANTGCSVKGEGSYLMGKKVSLSAKASKEKIFVGFYDEMGTRLTEQLKYSFVMGRENRTLTAKFKEEIITINTSALTSKTWKVGETVNVTIPVTAESGVKSVKAKLPTGLKLAKTKDNKWQVTGSPKKVGDYAVTFTVGTVQKKQKSETIKMMVEAESVTINTAAVKNKTLNVGQVASGLTIGATATSGIKSVKASKLPAGVKVQQIDGVWQLTGAPKKAGTYSVTLTITTKANTKVTETFTLTVALIPEWAVKTFSGEVVNVWEEDDGEVEMYGYAQITVLATGEVKGRVSLDDGAFATLSGTAKLLESSTNEVRLQIVVPWFDPYGKADGKVKTDLVIQKTGQGVTLTYLDVAKDSSVTGTLR